MINTEYRIPDFTQLPLSRLESMRDSGLEIFECQRALKKGGLNIVGEVLREQGTFYEMDHYPKGDVFDPDSHSQYYYHSHRSNQYEHGHFHTFLRSPGMPKDVEPVPYTGDEPWPLGEEALSHLISISMDKAGIAIGLFAVNRWVTGDTWYPAADVIRMLDRFVIDHAYTSWPTNRWISAMIRFYYPQIVELIDQRDRVVAEWAEKYPNLDAYEDRKLEITGFFKTSDEEQFDEINRSLELVS